jgi:hypothetical protein
MKIKLKVNDEGFAYVEDGMPVFIHEDDDNKESPMDVVKVMTGLDAKNKAQSEEIKRHVEGKEKLKTQLEAYEGIDPEKYKENAEFVEKHKDTKLVDEQGVETLKRKMKENFEAEKKVEHENFGKALKEKDVENGNLQEIIFKQAVLNKFATSPHFSGDNPKTTLAPKHAAAIFGNNFKCEIHDKEVVVVGIGNDGTPLISKIDHGEPADFEESIALLIEADPMSHNIYGDGRPGGPGASGNLNSNSKEFAKLSPQEKIKQGLKKRKGI